MHYFAILAAVNGQQRQQARRSAQVERLIRQEHARTGQAPSLVSLRAKGLPVKSFLSTHGSYSTFLEEEGLERPLRAARWTREELIEALLRETNRTGRTPTARTWIKATSRTPSKQTVRKEFGGWSQFLKAAGLEPVGPEQWHPRKWTSETIIAALIRWRQERGEWPLKPEWSCAGPWWPSDSSVRDVFRRWSIAVNMAKDEWGADEIKQPHAAPAHRSSPRKRGQWPRERITEAARAWYREKGEWPTTQDWGYRKNGHMYPSYRIVRARFASWNEMLSHAGRPTPMTPTSPVRRPIPYHIQCAVLGSGVCSNPYCHTGDPVLRCDHIVPLAEGGTDEIENLQPLCSTCNSRRQKMSWSDFVEQQKVEASIRSTETAAS